MDPEPTTNPRPKRSCRSRIIVHPLEEQPKQVVSRPKKILDSNNLKQVHSYYLDKRVKRLPPSLETIFEEPKEVNDEVVFMSTRKFNRFLTFDKTSHKSKVKKRHMKAKSCFPKKSKIKKISVDLLMKTLSLLEENLDNLPVNIVEQNKIQLKSEEAADSKNP